MNQTQAPPGGSTKLVIISAAIALLAVVLTNLYIANIRNQIEARTFELYVLNKPVPAGERIRNADVKVIKVPDTPDFREAVKLLGAMDSVGLKVRIEQREALQRPANASEILTYAHFTGAHGEDIDSQITKGLRLIELPIDSRRIPGALRVGAYVDIAAAFPTDRGVEVLPVMEMVKIIALGTRTAYQSAEEAGMGLPRSFRSMTIEVTPEQAIQFSMIERLAVGDFDLLLRNPGDRDRPTIPNGGINPAVLELVKRRLKLNPRTAPTPDTSGNR